MGTDELKRQPEDQSTNADLEPITDPTTMEDASVKEAPPGTMEAQSLDTQAPTEKTLPPERSLPRFTLNLSIRTRLLILLLGLTTIAVLAVSYLGVNSVQSLGISAQQISDEALRSQAREYLVQLAVGEAQRNDLLLQKIQNDTQNIAQYAASIFGNPDAFIKGSYWKAEDHMFFGPDEQYKNDENDVSSAFAPNSVQVDAELQRVLELGAYLDFVFAPTYENDPNTVAIYMGTEQETTQYYPNIDLGSVVPPDFQVTQRPWYLNAQPANNPERKVIWTPVYADATGKGLMVTAAAPIYTPQDNFVGVVGIDVTLQDIGRSVEANRVLGSGYTFLIDDTGHAIALPEQGYLDIIGRPAEPDEVGVDLSEGKAEFAPILANMMVGLRGFESIQVDGSELFIAYAPLESTGWSIANVVRAENVLQATGILQQELETSTQSLMLARIVPVGTGILLAVLVIGLLLTNRLTTPLQRLATAAQRIGAGQWDTPLPSTSNDEIGALSQAFATMTVRLRELMEELEFRVVRRTEGLQAAAEVAHATTQMLDPEELLRRVVDLVQERFGLYYVGLFLVEEKSDDPDHPYAVLRAGTGKAGRQMLAQEHKLVVGGESMIGQCVARGEARIALDVGEEAVRFDNPLLPETRSEMALPLRSRGRVIGAMTVQSVEEAAFDSVNIAVLQTMADQVAVAIDNARLFTEAQSALEEMEKIHQRYLGQAWIEHTRGQEISGYVQTSLGVTPLENEVLPEVQRAVTEQEPVILNHSEESPSIPAGPVEPSTLAVPIMLRGQAIGALGFKATNDRPWTADEIALAEAIAEQLALAADNLRLLDETQRRAAREQLTSEITARMRETLNIEAVLKTAADEIYQALQLDKVAIRLVAENGKVEAESQDTVAGEPDTRDPQEDVL